MRLYLAFDACDGECCAMNSKFRLKRIRRTATSSRGEEHFCWLCWRKLQFHLVIWHRFRPLKVFYKTKFKWNLSRIRHHVAFTVHLRANHASYSKRLRSFRSFFAFSNADITISVFNSSILGAMVSTSMAASDSVVYSGSSSVTHADKSRPDSWWHVWR